MIPPLVEGRSLRFPDQEITWAGECPWTGGFCFGTESGDLLICGSTAKVTWILSRSRSPKKPSTMWPFREILSG